jgi:TetR/AcrR family transcriptional repressor of nem operon
MARKGEDTRSRILVSAQALVMARGFAGTSIDDIVKDADLTKGAFFHHFKGKADLARALVEKHARTDLTMFDEFAERAERESDDPMEQVVLFLKYFEEMIEGSDDPSPGCMYAAYTYESMQFEPAVLDLVADSMRRWTSTYVRKFQEVLDRYEPALPVTARQLAEMIVSLIEGGLVLQRAYADQGATRRQSEQFRNYLTLLFPGAAPADRKAAPRRRAAVKSA